MSLSELQQLYREDGVVFLPGALTSEDLAKVEHAYDWMLANPNETHVKFYPKEDATFLQATGYSADVPAFAPMLKETPIPRICADLFGNAERPGPVWYLGEQLFLKEGGAARRTPWHQDSSYLAFNGDKIAVMWISLDPLPPEACLEVIPGSHKGITWNGSMFHPDDDTIPLYAKADLPRLPDIQVERSNPDSPWDIRSWPVTPGDVLIFHTACLHGGGATMPGQRRRTLTLRFFGDDVAWIERPQRNDRLSGQNKGKGRTVQHTIGEPLSKSPLFRQVYPLISKG